MEEQVEITDLDIYLPPLLALEHAIAIYCEHVYVYCGCNLKQTAMILEITEKQLVAFLDEELDFS